MFGASKSGSAALPSDPDFEYVTLLLDGNGTNGGQNNTFVDSSTNNFTITRNGNTTQGSFSPYGSLWSIYSDGSGDYLSISDSASFPSGTTEFCYEIWFYPTANTNSSLFAKGGDNGYFEQVGVYYTSGNLICYIANSSNVYIVNAGNFGTPTVGQWNHVAVYRSGNNFYGSLNGTVTSLATSSNSVIDSAAAFVVSGYSTPNPVALPVTGYISNLRLVTGSAVYGASNFTPPTTPLTAITGTQLLMCQANRFIDSSSNAFSITVGGNPSVQRFSPFEPSAPYSTSVIGGSGYFDGTGDTLSVANNANLQTGTGAFTYEFWIKGGTGGTLFRKGGYGAPDGSGLDGVELYTDGAGQNLKLLLGCGTGGSTTPGAGYDVIEYTGTGSWSNGAWHHIAIVRSGNNFALYLDGVSQGNVASSAWEMNNTEDLILMGRASNQYVTGTMADFRFTKGAALYTTGFTPPSAPLTTTVSSGTVQFLANFTNASIFDYAMQNDLETVGNAQISTSVVKYGTGSIYLDGTGDWLAAPATPQTDLGSGDFTIECWLYRTASGAASDSGMVSRGAPSTTNGFVFGYTSSNVLTFNFNYSGAIVTGSTAISVNTWTHVAVTRSGSTFRLFVNGTVDATATSSNSQTTNASDVFYVGRSGFGSDRIVTGYLDDVRITKGLARYTANFTAPTAPFPIY